MERLERPFQQEIRALRGEGELFAQDFPESARFLGTHGDSELDQDPYVDRLTEGAALLLARVRETLIVEQDGFSGFCWKSWLLVWTGLFLPSPW